MRRLWSGARQRSHLYLRLNSSSSTNLGMVVEWKHSKGQGTIRGDNGIVYSVTRNVMGGGFFLEAGKRVAFMVDPTAATPSALAVTNEDGLPIRPTYRHGEIVRTRYGWVVQTSFQKLRFCICEHQKFVSITEGLRVRFAVREATNEAFAIIVNETVTPTATAGPNGQKEVIGLVAVVRETEGYIEMDRHGLVYFHQDDLITPVTVGERVQFDLVATKFGKHKDKLRAAKVRRMVADVASAQ